MVRLDLKILLLASAATLIGCAGTIDRDGALAVVPFHVTDDGRVVVDVRLNDQGPYPFAVDTGSSISIVFDEIHDELQLASEEEIWANIQGLVSSGRFPIYSIDRLQINGETWADARVVLMPGNTPARAGIDGILGNDFLRRYALGFSVKERVVRLYPPDLVSERAYRGWSSVPLKPAVVGTRGATLYFFTIKIRGQSISAMLDLGAGLNIINWPAARLVGLDPARLKADESLSGAVGSTPVIARFTAREVTTNRIRWRNEEFTVAETEVFSILPLGDTPSAILGYGFLGQRDFIIDFFRNRLLINVAMEEEDSGSDE
jgi:hypothetical protein